MERLKAIKKTIEKGICTACPQGDHSAEFAEEILFDNYTKGVSFRTTGDRLKVTYNGLLAKSGANEITAVIGYGDNQSWNNVKHITMNRLGEQTFEFLLPVSENENVNIAFKDSSNNWDNNAGRNYSFYVH